MSCRRIAVAIHISRAAFRRGSLAAAAFLAAAFLSLSASVAAQERVLTEADFVRAAPLLRAAIAERNEHLASEQAKADAARPRNELMAGVVSGTIDPRAWLQQHFKRMPVPPGATYDPACSRRWAPSGVYAVFTFGVEALDSAQGRARLERKAATIDTNRIKVDTATVAKMTTGDAGALEKMLGSFDEMGKAFKVMADAPKEAYVSPEGERLIQRVLAFYKSQGYKLGTYNRMDPSQTLLPPAGAPAAVLQYTRLSGPLSDLPECDGLATGPALMIAVSWGEAFQVAGVAEANDEGPRGAGAPSSLEQALAAARMTREQFDELVSELWTAWRDNANPAMLDMLEKQAATAEHRDAARVRRANATGYRNHAATLTPLMRAYHPGLQ